MCTCRQIQGWDEDCWTPISVAGSWEHQLRAEDTIIIRLFLLWSGTVCLDAEFWASVSEITIFNLPQFLHFKRRIVKHNPYETLLLYTGYFSNNSKRSVARSAAQEPPWPFQHSFWGFQAWLHQRLTLSRWRPQQQQLRQHRLTLTLPWVDYVQACDYGWNTLPLKTVISGSIISLHTTDGEHELCPRFIDAEPSWYSKC